MKRRDDRVYPERPRAAGGSTENSLSVSKHLNAVDGFVEDIEKEINQISDDAENFATQLYLAGNDRYSSGRSKPKAIRYSGSSNRADEVEEIKLSHEIIQDEMHVTKQLDESFNVLKKQVDEYRKLYTSTNHRLKDTEAKRLEAEGKLDNSLEENAKLVEEIKQTRANQGSKLYNVPLGGGGGRANEELQKRSDDLRKALLFENDDEDVAITLDDLWKAKNFGKRLMEYINYVMPFKKDISKIQSSFGSSVASYFIFYRFLFIQTFCATLVVLLFAFLHVFYISQHSHGSSAYRTYVYTSGHMAAFTMYSSYSTAEGLNYDLCLLFILGFTLISLCWKLVNEDKLAKNLEALEAENHHPYSKEVLCAWDFSLKAKADVDDSGGNIGNKLLQQLEESRSSGAKAARSRYQWFLVYARRCLGMFIYSCVLLASFVIILYVTVYGDAIAKKVSSIPGLSNIQSFIAPLMLTTISSAMPEIAKMITSLESWDTSATVTTMRLLRVYVSSLLNTLLLVFSYMVLADPFLLADNSSLRNSFGLTESDAFECRMDQIADGLFTLVMFTWMLNGAMLLGMPYANKVLAFVTRTPYKKSEFQVSDGMVKRLNLMGLSFAAATFSPLTFAIMPLLLYVGFKWEKWVIKRHYVKPLRPFSGQKAALIYTFFYLCTIVAIGITFSAYFLTTRTFIKECSLQDNYVHLCGSSLSSDNTCSLDTGSDFYDFYRTMEYPKALCDKACGAFVNEASNLSPFHYRVSQLFIVSILWTACFKYPYIPWVGLILLVLWIARTKNALDVLKISAYHRERGLEVKLQANEAERKRQEKMIKKLKTIGSADDGAHDE